MKLRGQRKSEGRKDGRSRGENVQKRGGGASILDMAGHAGHEWVNEIKVRIAALDPDIRGGRASLIIMPEHLRKPTV